MKGFLFFRGIIEKQELNVISQNEYNRRRDALAELSQIFNNDGEINSQEEYLRNLYEQERLGE